MRISLMVVILLAWTSAARADRGSIPFKLDVKIYEPNQDALIAWNGREQLLLLQTKLRASKPTKILELIPLPSKPTVEKGNTKAFARATALINRRQRRRARSRNGDLGDPFNGHGKRKPAAVVRERKRIGAHDIAVVEVLRKKDFVAWVHTFLAKQGLPASLLPAPLTRITERYLSDGYRWFVFDVVAVGTRNTRIAPIAYRFASTSLYYPLRITQLESGNSRVKLLLFTRRGVRFAQTRATIRAGEARRRFRCYRQVRPFYVSQRQLRRVDKAAATVMANGSVRLSQWACSGSLVAARFDLLGKAPPAKARRKKRRARGRRSRTKDLYDPFK
jgi:hypothetical protein